jgi:galactose mutarotase-like enzyme
MYITSNNWALSLSLNGGRVENLSYNDIKVFSTYNRIDGKLGNTHLCIPSFDKEGIEKYNLPFHGLVRNAVWNMERRTENEISISTITQASTTYPASLKVEQVFLMDKDFSHTIIVSHISGEAVPVNIGVHYYWDTPRGWNETQINNTNIATNFETNGFIKLEQTNKVVFPHATYQLTSKGFNNAVLWTSFKTNEMGEKQYSQDFCCIEPVLGWLGYFGTERSILRPGKSISASISLKKVV